MTVSPIQEDGIIWRNFVEIPARRKHRWSPESFNPAASGNPFAGLFLHHTLFYFDQKVLKVVNAFEVEGHLTKPDSGKMVMRISHSRYHRPATEIDNARIPANILLRLAI